MLSGSTRVCTERKKKRYCTCGRELEKYKTYCSECAQINIDLSNSIHNHNQQESGYKREYMREYMRRERSEKIRINKIKAVFYAISVNLQYMNHQNYFQLRDYLCLDLSLK